MKKVYILVNNKSLESVLISLLDIIGYLPIVLHEEDSKRIKNKTIENIIFTNYYFIQKNIKYLQNFNNIVVFVPYGSTFIDTKKTITNNIVYFSQTLTVSNIKNLLNKLIM